MNASAYNPRLRIALAGGIFLALAALAVAAVYAASWRAQMRAKAPQAAGDGRYAWLSAALDACEAEASKYPQSLYFMVVPMAAASSGADALRSRALETIGPATLLESKVALQGLESGALRISREQFILHAIDVDTNAIHRWSSVSGVSTLSDRNNTAKGPFKIRLQTSPNDGTEWSAATADGVATCHWVFALLQR